MLPLLATPHSSFTPVRCPQKADSYEFDPLDVTKTWPEDRFPLQPVGRMVLNRCAGCAAGPTQPVWPAAAVAAARQPRTRSAACIHLCSPLPVPARSNPDNFFNENEQLAFCPALVVPGACAWRLGMPGGGGVGRRALLCRGWCVGGGVVLRGRARAADV